MKKMKSTMRKLLLSALAASFILTGCNKASEVDGTDDPAVNDTVASESEEPSETEAEGDVIIPLYKPEYEDEIRAISPEDFLNFDHFSYYFPLTKSKVDDNGKELYQLDFGDSFDLRYDSFSLETGYSLEGIDPATTESVKVYFASWGPLDNLSLECECGSQSDDIRGFIPLFYNQTKGCLVGYKTEEPATKLVEVYHGYIQVLEYERNDGELADIKNIEDYGFTALPEANGLTIDTFVPLYKTDKENEIKTMSPDVLYDFDKIGEYFDLEEHDSDGEGFSVYKLKTGADIVLKDTVTSNPDNEDMLYKAGYIFYGRTGDISAGFYVDEEKTIMETGSLSSYYDFSKGNSFIPLFYNQTKQCLVGFVPEAVVQMFKDSNVATYKDTPYYVVEVYHGPSMPYGDIFPAEPSRYGL